MNGLGGYDSQQGASIGQDTYRTAQAAAPAAQPAEDFEIALPTMRWEGTPEAQAKLVEAIAGAMLEFGQVERSGSGQIGNRRFDYAPLVQYTKATRKALAGKGVITLQGIHTSPLASPERKLHRLTTQVRGHGAGLIIELDFRPPASTSTKVDDSSEVKDTQEWGKLTTYLRRYHYATTFVLDGDPDLDEGGDQAPAPEPQKSRTPPTPKSQPLVREPKPESRPTPQAAPKPAEPKPEPKPELKTSVPTAELQRVVDEGTKAAANGNGSGMEHMSDEDIRLELRKIAVELGHNATTAQRRCIAITGKPREELDRAGAEALLAGFRADLIEKEEGEREALQH